MLLFITFLFSIFIYLFIGLCVCVCVWKNAIYLIFDFDRKHNFYWNKQKVDTGGQEVPNKGKKKTKLI